MTPDGTQPDFATLADDPATLGDPKRAEKLADEIAKSDAVDYAEPNLAADLLDYYYYYHHWPFDGTAIRIDGHRSIQPVGPLLIAVECEFRCEPLVQICTPDCLKRSVRRHEVIAD